MARIEFSLAGGRLNADGVGLVGRAHVGADAAVPQEVHRGPEDSPGASTDQAIRSILIVKDLLGLDELWDGLAPYPVAPTMPIRQALERALEYNASWLVRRNSRLGAIDQEPAGYAPTVARLRKALTTRSPGGSGSPLNPGLAALVELIAPEQLMTGCRAVARLQSALALASAADESGFDVVELEETYARIGDTLGLS